MRDLLGEGWRTPRVLIGAAIGVVMAILAIVVLGDGAAPVVFAAFVLAFVGIAAFYVWSLWYLRFTEKGRAAWAEHRSGTRRPD